MAIHWKYVEQYFTVVLCFFFFNFTQFVILDLALSGVKGLKDECLVVAENALVYPEGF